MLVLSRKAKEGITIDDHIKIVVIEIRGKRVRLGIEAPKSFGVQRTLVDAERHADASLATNGSTAGPSL